jgi:hypothetical protein
VIRTWDVAQGVCEANGTASRLGSVDPSDTLDTIATRAKQGGDRCVWVLRDVAPFLTAPVGLREQRKLRNLARLLPGVPRDNAQAVIVLAATAAEIPAELAAHATVIEWPLPDRAEIAGLLDAAIASLPDSLKDTAAPNGTRDAAIDAAVGLTGEEVQACYSKSLVQHKRIDPLAVGQEKKRVITRERVLEWFDPLAGGLDAVGGLGTLKAWLLQRRGAYSAKARAYGLPAPKGFLLVGPPGTGKSLTAKAAATALGVPLLKIDLGALKSKFVGESEANLRKAFRVIEAIGRCVVWFDEVEKSLAGATEGAADGGVSSDALGAVLTWMQERQGQAFVVATANDVSRLPPELLRKGRFDEIFFVDLPTGEERVAVLKAALATHGRKDVKLDFAAVANVCTDFTGAEIAAIVPDALFTAFGEDRELETRDLVEAAKLVVPLAKTASEKIAKVRDWAIKEGRARPASVQVTERLTGGGRVVDI